MRELNLPQQSAERARALWADTVEPHGYPIVARSIRETRDDPFHTLTIKAMLAFAASESPPATQEPGDVARLRGALQSAWDDCTSLPPIVFTEAEADHLIASIAPPAARVSGAGRGAENLRAVERAKQVLKPGDRLLIGTCGNSRGTTVTMVGWSESFPDFIASKTMVDDELHPINVRKVNGVPTSFADPVAE